jgi:hypothetical protein
MTRLELGYRGSFVINPGYNPFSTNDYLPQFSLAATRTVFTQGRFSFAPGFAWDYGGSSATARGDTTSLSMHRLTVPLEGRAHFGDWGYAFVRAAPGLAALKAEVDEPSAPEALTKSKWVFATDVSAGYAWLAAPRNSGRALVGRLWLQADVGYGWVADMRLDLTPGNQPRANGIDLGTLAMNGAFFRIEAAASF